MRHGPSGNRARYGIRINNANCDNNLVTNNDLLNAGITGGFSDLGTGSVTTPGNNPASGGFTPSAHAASHAPGGSDALTYTQSGTLASRPAAAAGNAGYLYFATDDNGGTLYLSTGSAWTRISPMARLLGEATRSTVFTTTTAGVEYDVTGMTKTVIVEDKPVRATFSCPWGIGCNTAGSYTLVNIYRGTTVIAQSYYRSVAANDSIPLNMQCPTEVLTPGSYTYKVTVIGGWLASGVSKVDATTTSKMSLRIMEANALG